MQRVNINDPNLKDIGFDVNGEFVMAYNGVYFTGIVESYYTNNQSQISDEEEYVNGYVLGIYRSYHPNGQLEEEYHIDEGGFDGTCKEWDVNGILIHSSVWIKGIKQL